MVNEPGGQAGEGSAGEGPVAEEPVDEGRVAVGHINAPWGVRGHVKVTPLTDNDERFARGEQCYVAGVRRRIVDVRSPRGFPVVLFEGIRGTDEAEGLRGALIEIDEEELPPLPEGEHYIHDLIGLAVVTTGGDELGRLDDVLRTGSNDVYLVRAPGKKDVLIPVLEDVVVEVDLQSGRVVVDPPLGLLD